MSYIQISWSLLRFNQIKIEIEKLNSIDYYEPMDTSHFDCSIYNPRIYGSINIIHFDVLNFFEYSNENLNHLTVDENINPKSTIFILSHYL